MSQSPITTSPTKPTETPISSSPIVDATPITTIHPSFASALNPKPKKTTAKRTLTSKTSKSKKKSKASSPSVSKKSSKAKGSKSKLKSINTMQELYVDDVTKGNAENLETQKGETGEKSIVSDTVVEAIVNDSPDAEESLNNNVVGEALNSLKDTIPKPNVALDVATSLAQEEPIPTVVGNNGNVEEQVDDEPVSDELCNTPKIPA
ncbi:hypothetical protein QL285_008483 [Trifolium repens]|nr:hypothetical protein QL285_008483 [Trifolium repens]